MKHLAISQWMCGRCLNSQMEAPRWILDKSQPLKGTRLAVCSACYRNAPSRVRRTKSPDRLSKSDLPWVTYIARAIGAGKVKIGQSRDVKARLEQLNSLSPYTIELLFTAEETESELHDRFRHLLIKREWFRETDDLAVWISEKSGETPKMWSPAATEPLHAQAQQTHDFPRKASQ